MNIPHKIVHVHDVTEANLKAVAAAGYEGVRFDIPLHETDGGRLPREAGIERLELVKSAGLFPMAVLYPWGRREWASDNVRDWWANRTAGGPLTLRAREYEEWRREHYPNQKRIPRRIWDDVRWELAQVVNEGRGLFGEDIAWCWWNEPDGAGGVDPATGENAGWDASFFAITRVMVPWLRMAGSGTWISPSFTSDRFPTRETMHALRVFGTMDLFHAVGMSVYQTASPGQPWREAYHARAKAQIDLARLLWPDHPVVVTEAGAADYMAEGGVPVEDRLECPRICLEAGAAYAVQYTWDDAGDKLSESSKFAVASAFRPKASMRG